MSKKLSGKKSEVKEVIREIHWGLEGYGKEFQF